MGRLDTTPFAVWLRDFFLAKAWRRAMPHAWRELGRPPEIVGLWVELYAPIPLRTTFFAVGKVIFLVGFALLYSFRKAFILFVSPSLNFIEERVEADALPRLLVLLPLMRSFFGAGVCAAPLRPALFFAISTKQENPFRWRGFREFTLLLLLLTLQDDDGNTRQNQEVVNILSAQECVGVFDV